LGSGSVRFFNAYSSIRVLARFTFGFGFGFVLGKTWVLGTSGSVHSCWVQVISPSLVLMGSPFKS